MFSKLLSPDPVCAAERHQQTEMSSPWISRACYDTLVNGSPVTAFQWIADLPNTIRALATAWDLVIDRPLFGGHTGAVITCSSATHGECVLKIIHSKSLYQWQVLSMVNLGRTGVVPHLYEISDVHQAFLMERIQPGTPANEKFPADILVPLIERLQACTPLIGVPTTEEVAAVRYAHLCELVRTPTEKAHLEQSMTAVNDLPLIEPRLLHGDLAPAHVLAGSNGVHRFIDLEAMFGDPALDIAGWAIRANPFAMVLERLSMLANAMQIPLSHALAWLWFLAVDEAANHGRQGFAERSLAEWAVATAAAEVYDTC